jgi:hypothetical protein
MNPGSIRNNNNKGGAIFLPLTDRLIVENRATNARTEAARGHNQRPTGAPGFLTIKNDSIKVQERKRACAQTRHARPWG